jgi:hypothetical protein
MLLGPLAAAGQGQDGLGVRARLESMARHLEREVARVSGSGQALTGVPSPLQAVHVPGLGVVVILPPRALPSRRAGEARAVVAEPPPPPAAPSEGVPSPPAAAAAPRTLVTAPLALDQLETDLRREMALRQQLQQQLERARGGDGAALERALELQMLLVHEEAEAFRMQVEQFRQQAEQELRVQLSVRALPTRPSSAPATPPAADAGPASAAPPSPPAPPDPTAGGPPPWRFWLGAPRASMGPPGALVQQVHEAILSALEAHGADLRGLDPRESVTVAVDFVGSGGLARRPRVRRTLVVRVSLAELQARLDGKLTPAEFRQRVQARQY